MVEEGEGGRRKGRGRVEENTALSNILPGVHKGAGSVNTKVS